MRVGELLDILQDFEAGLGGHAPPALAAAWTPPDLRQRGGEIHAKCERIAPDARPIAHP